MKRRMGQIVKMLRKNSSLTQQELSRLSGVRTAAISEFETGRRDLYATSLLAIFDVLGVECKRKEKKTFKNGKEIDNKKG